MSRIAKQPVKLPQGVAATIAADAVTVKGAKGALTLKIAEGVTVSQKDQVLQVAVAAGKSTGERIAATGATRANLANMVTGVSKGFERKLELVGVGYRAAVQCESPTAIAVRGVSRQRVGQVAANIRGYRPPEPYKGKGVRYAGEKIVMKEGKKK